MTDLSELDELMDLDPLSLTLDDPRLDKLIAHYRSQRGAGPRPKKETGPKISLADLVKQIAPQAKPTIKRRI